MEAPMIKLKHVSKVYRTTEVETTALRDLSLDIPKGQFLAVMGPSGSGKSTFLNIVGMLDSPSAGEYWFDGQNIVGYSQTQLAQLRKHAIGFIFQSFNLIDELNVLENVELALLYHGDVSARERRKRANEALDRMKITHRKHHMPSQLSGGQQQRVAIARAVVARPKLILADEPTGNLDSVNGEEVMQLLAELNDEGTTIVMVTHSPTHAEYAHRIVSLLDGTIVTENIRQIA
jgi:putative ABC transport system ATP-binding protein